MTRLIDADALLEEIYKNDGWDYHLALHTIKNAPTVQRESAKSYPNDCPVSDFHCTYPECGCGR